MKTLRTRLFAICIATIVIPLSVINVLLPHYYNEQITRETQKLTQTSIKILAQNIDTYLSELQYASASYFISDDYLWALSQRDTANYDKLDYYTRFKVEDSIRNMLAGFLFKTRSDTLSTLLVTNDGTGYLSTRKQSFRQIPDTGYDFQQQEWYAQASERAGRGVLVDTDIFDTLDPRRGLYSDFTLARQIREPISGRPLGVLLVNFNTRYLERILQDIEFNVDSIIGINTGSGTIVYSNRPVEEAVRRQMAESEEVLAGSGDTYILSSSPIADTGWELFVLISQTQLKAKNHALLLFGNLCALAVGLAAFLIFLLLSRYITRPFHKIVHTIREVEQGNMQARCQLTGTDEISSIGCKLDGMLSEINHSIEREYKAEINRKNLEYLALQSQVNPHFLFNTLNSFVALNRLDQKEILEQAIYDLTGIMRYSLNQRESFVTLAEELDFIEKYCKLQELRCPGRFQYDIYYENEVANFRIPRMLLQPLVENSVIHGLEEMTDMGRVHIRAVLNKQAVEILVQDNGVGFDQQKVDTVHSVGLSNVRERLHYTYPDAVFTIESRIDEGTRVWIYIPGRRTDD
ncbi:sensor histidine kinase [Diplocloster hominis]|uniref:cache domain-containing sensor histidine kinase n=1 Tax=Diplocloster hominis TaxID=3079010 RepID=UPI0031BBB972